MQKKVSDLTPEEFQKTFPIKLVPYKSDYNALYEQEKISILNTVNNDDIIRINHIGSTAIPNIIAKPIVDILLEIKDSCDVAKLQDELMKIGFGIEFSVKGEKPLNLLLAKGMFCDGFAENVFFLHIRYYGDWDELYFRDYLIDHPETAAEYGSLKEQILQDIEDGKIDRWPNGKPNGYSQAKYSYVSKITKKARKAYKKRYLAVGNVL